MVMIMKLTNEQREMLEGNYGNAVKKSMNILVALGEIFGAKKLIPIKSVQVSGVSYHNLGDAGLEFLEEMAEDGKVRVKTTLNPAGMDRERWKELGISEDFAEKQIKVIDAFGRMGIETTCTCTPYFIGNKPDKGEHVSWGESSAVTYANSVLGAYTNKEGGPSALAAALTGFTPEYGFHLDENRIPSFVVNVKALINKPMLFGALGMIIGRKAEGRVPLIKGIEKATTEDLKSFSASVVTYGSAPLFHIEGITPNIYEEPKDSFEVTDEDIRKALEEMNDTDDVDFVFIGCPHCSIDELKKISELLDGKTVKKEFWIGVARPVKSESDKLGYTKIIEEAGVKFACDTCHVVAPIKGRFKGVATNSGKGVFYGRGKNKFNIVYRDLEGCIELAVKE